jgi:hypothetical protein
LAIAAYASAKPGSCATAFSNIWSANSMSCACSGARSSAAQVEVVGLQVLGRLAASASCSCGESVMRSASAILRAISSCTSNTSAISRS